MDSDGDQLLLSRTEEPSPQVHNRRLKRLKKSSSKRSPKSPLLEPIDDPLFSSVDFAKLEALENDSETLAFNYSNPSEDPFLSHESLSQGIGNEDGNDMEDEMQFDAVEAVRKTKRVLEFDDVVVNGVDVNEKRNGQENLDSVLDNSLKERRGAEEILLEEKEGSKKKKRTKRDRGNQSKTKAPQNKRKEEKERQAYLKDLHAESQRLLRETRNATFKPVPVVQKPISSVLEKIRKRKLEISKKSSNCEANIGVGYKKLDLDVSNEYVIEQTTAKAVEKDKLAPLVDGESSIYAPNFEETKDAPKQTSHENDCEPVSLDEVPMHVFRAPVHDTQDLFDDSEPHGSSPEQRDEQLNSPMEEEFAPSLLAMNLTLDSAPTDDSSSDEEDNDKENINPHPYRITESSSPKSNTVKGFVDDEAEEEDDSDNDLIRFKDTEEDEDIDDVEELNDMITTTYEERPVDNEKRNELHQKWLEQQDAAENDNLMQRLNRGFEPRDTFLSDEEPGRTEHDDINDEVKEDSMPMNCARINIRKAKQIILQLASDKEDVYVSDDDEDADRRHARSFLSRREEQSIIVSPADDESSREVFGLIRKLNIVSDNKKKPKTSSFFDSVLSGGNSNSSSKSSFLGRLSNHPRPPTCKKGPGTVRSFIFGRDDSNSRSSMSMSEDSTDTVPQEARPTRNFTAKYSNSQTKFHDRNRDTSAETASGTSLFDLLKKPSSQSQVCHQHNTVDLTKSIFAFRVPKKPVKIEGRS